MTRERDIRKSNFPAVTSTLPSDTFDLVRNGQNVKITQANLVGDLGVTGVIQAQGEITGIPVLDQIGTVNNIRNILGGNGITALVSPQDGIKLDHNFTIDKTGVAVVINENSASPTVRSISAGTGISVAAADGEIQISSTAVPGTAKTIFVYDIDDLPTPSGGVITLADNTEYRFLNDVSSGNRFVLGDNTIISGADQTLICLEYTGAGVMFTSADKNWKLKDICVQANAGTMFAVTCAGGTHGFAAWNVVINAATLGSITNLEYLVFDDADITLTVGGLTLASNFQITRFNFMRFNLAAAAVGINLGSATFDAIAFKDCFFDIIAGGTSISGLTASGNINAGGLGTITRCQQFGASTFLANISPFDNLWEMLENSGISNSNNSALATNGGTTVTIPAASTPVLIGANWTSVEENRFTITGAGRFTYNGKGAHVDISASISADLTTGIDDCTFFVALNGSTIAASGITREIDAGNIGNLSLLWHLELTTGDYIEFFCQNDDTNVDIIISNIIARLG